MEAEEEHHIAASGGRQQPPNRCLLRAMFHTSRRKRGQGRMLGRCCGHPRTTSFQDRSDDMNPSSFRSDPALPLLVEAPASKKSGKALPTQEILVANKMSIKLRLLRTYSLNQQQYLSQHGADWATNPIIIVHKTPKATPKLQEARKPAHQLSTVAEKYDEDGQRASLSDAQQKQLSKECLDLLDLFMVNKSQFLEIIKDKEAQFGNSFLARHTSTKNSRLRKSGSFPAVDSTTSPRLLAPSMLAHKHMEVWSSPKRSTFKLANPAVGNPVNEQKVKSFPSQGENKRKWIVSIMAGFKGVKQRILKRVLDKSRKKNKRVSIGETTLRNWIRLRRGRHRRSRIISPVKGHMFQVRRTTSLSESLHRYTPLMEQSSSFGNNQTTWQYRKSQSLRLTNEDKSHQSTENHLKYSFRRRLSLSDVDAILQAKQQFGTTCLDADLNPETGSYNQQDETMASRWISVDRKELEEETPLDCMGKNEASESSRIAVRIDEERVDQSNFLEDTELASSIPSSNDDQKPVENIPIEEAAAAAAESSHVMEGVQLKLDDGVGNEDSADFNYVRDVLEVSGLLDQNDCCPGTLWYALDQPLSPLVFKELESLVQSMEEDSISSSTHRRLLFDLVNEELLGMFENWLTYFPKPLNIGQGSRVIMPQGKRILEEVWSRIHGRGLPKMEMEMEMSLFDMFWRDMKVGDGWMKIHMESEDVTLEIEDLIIDQLLEEVLCC